MTNFIAKFIATTSKINGELLEVHHQYTNTDRLEFKNKNELEDYFQGKIQSILNPKKHYQSLMISNCSISPDAAIILGQSLIRLLNTNLKLTKIEIEPDIILPIHQKIITKHINRNKNLPKTSILTGSGIVTVGLILAMKIGVSPWKFLLSGIGAFGALGLVGLREREVHKRITEHEKLTVKDLPSYKTSELESIKAGLEASSSWTGWIKGMVDSNTWANLTPYYKGRYLLSQDENVNEIKDAIDAKLTQEKIINKVLKI